MLLYKCIVKGCVIINSFTESSVVGMCGRLHYFYYTGYIRIKNVELETSATEDEKKKIENLLKLGVVIEQAQTSTIPSNDLYSGQ